MREHARTGPDTAAGIRAVALELFSSRGYDRSTLREIAGALGISKAAVYYHYRAKAEILEDLLRPFGDRQQRIIDEAEAAAAKAPVGDSAWRATVLKRYGDLLLEHRRPAALAFRDLADAAGSTQMARVRAGQVRLIALISDGADSVDHRVRTFAALGAMMAILALPDPSDQLRPWLRAVVGDVLAEESQEPGVAAETTVPEA